jgi:SAM-dependent methyltransferase
MSSLLQILEQNRMNIQPIKLGLWTRYVQGTQRLVRTLGWRELIWPSANKHCCLCGFRGSFIPKAFGMDQCPMCKAGSHHRLEAWFLEKRGILRQGLRILHFAPETCLTKYLLQHPIRYETADLAQKGVTHKIDLQTQTISEGAYDLVIANHILEHIPDDRAALKNIWRMVASGGLAMFTVPIRTGSDETDEDLTVTDVQERTRRFGQGDHVRLYGKGDLLARLAGAGFEASTWTLPADAPVGTLTLGNDILFLGRKA